MALITDFTAFDAFRDGTETTAKTVGTNRQVTVGVNQNGKVWAECRLAGQLVLLVSRGGNLQDGFAQVQVWESARDSRATVSAINDFLRGFNIIGNATRDSAGLTVNGFCKRLGTIDFCERLGSGFTARAYRVTMQHDKGRARITTYADNRASAIDLVCKAELAPRSAVVKVQEAV